MTSVVAVAPVWPLKAGVTNNINHGSVLFNCPSDSWQSEHERYLEPDAEAEKWNPAVCYDHLCFSFCDLSNCRPVKKGPWPRDEWGNMCRQKYFIRDFKFEDCLKHILEDQFNC